jgi:hypothetical protein
METYPRAAAVSVRWSPRETSCLLQLKDRGANLEDASVANLIIFKNDYDPRVYI